MILTASVIPSHQLLVGLCSTHGTRGIDKVGISFVANSAPLPHNAGWTDWTSTKKGRRATTTLGMRGTNLTLHARPGKPLRGALEFTPSYVIGLPDNARVPPDTTFEELVRGMLDIICELTDLLPTQPPMQEIAVTRLDLTRDCHIDTKQSTISEFLNHARLIRPRNSGRLPTTRTT